MRWIKYLFKYSTRDAGIINAKKYWDSFFYVEKIGRKSFDFLKGYFGYIYSGWNFYAKRFILKIENLKRHIYDPQVRYNEIILHKLLED